MSTRTFVAGLFGLAVAFAASSASADPIPAFSTEAAAQKHCPKDQVVYGENKSGGVYHFKGNRYYGNLKNGTYVCRSEADAGGWRPAANNQ
jgi:hypothetical protein